jgi:pSer/pThr/pTyr-binding forkhead associated (FHA) protein
MDSFGKLVLIQSNAPDQEYELSKSSIALGRAATSDILISDARASRFHARIECTARGCIVLDLGSSNGTLLNDRKIDQALLSPGDVIQIGNSRLRYEDDRLSPELEMTVIDSEKELEQTINHETLPMVVNETIHPRLVVFTPEKTWEVSMENVETLKIGRSDENDLVLPYTKVSRNHAQLVRLGETFLLRDLGSTNGTFSDHQRVDEMILKDGDFFRIGAAQLFYKGGFSEGAQTLVNETLDQIPSRRPVIFIPGMMGSELWLGSERVWPSVKNMFMNPEIFIYSDAETNALKPGGIVDEIVIVPNFIKLDKYNRLGDYLVEELGYERGVNFFEFAYDWRQDVRLSSQKLAQMIDAIGFKQPVTLIAHSLGTLVARHYLARLGGDKIVERAMLMGGPHLGVPRAVMGLLVGPNILPLGIMGEKSRQVSMTFPTTYQILPTTDFPIGERGEKINFLENEQWLPEANRPLLRSAREFRREIASRLGVSVLSIFGYGIKTITDISIDGWIDGKLNNVVFLHEPKGDSGIPEASGVLEGSEIHPVQQYHGALFVDNDVKMRLKLELTRPR